MSQINYKIENEENSLESSVDSGKFSQQKTQYKINMLHQN